MSWSPVQRTLLADGRSNQASTSWFPVRRILDAHLRKLMAEPVAEWATVSRIVQCAMHALNADTRELSDVLLDASHLLEPFEDPFFTDFGTHGWLRRSREEAYSDWLAWILGELDNPADVFGVFDLDHPETATEWTSTAPEREWPIPDGRLDIVVRWPGWALLVVEVKVTDEQSASTVKQRRYRKWMERQPEKHKEAVLLVVDAEGGDSDGSFVRRDWRSVCLKLRGIVAALALAKRNNVELAKGRFVLAAMVLAFVGAVEQNLLDMPGKPVDLMKSGCVLNTLPIRSYVTEFRRSRCDDNALK